MILEYMVGLHVGNKHETVTVEAEDALIAALKVKHEKPNATITYVRKRNERGDFRRRITPSRKKADE